MHMMLLIAFVSQKYQVSTHLKLNATSEPGDGNGKRVQETLDELECLGCARSD